VSGVSLLQDIIHRLQHAFQILKHLIVPKSDYLNAVLPQKSRSVHVASNNTRFIVLTAVKLNGKLYLAAVKIEDELLKWVLTTKPETAKLFLPQTVPHQLFRIRHAFAQGAGRFEQWRRYGCWKEDVLFRVLHGTLLSYNITANTK